MNNAPVPEASVESNDISLTSNPFNGVVVRVNRPKEGEMYGIFFCAGEDAEEIAMIGGDTAEARKVYEEATTLFRQGKKPEEIKETIRRFISDLHGGTQK